MNGNLKMNKVFILFGLFLNIFSTIAFYTLIFHVIGMVSKDHAITIFGLLLLKFISSVIINLNVKNLEGNKNVKNK